MRRGTGSRSAARRAGRRRARSAARRRRTCSAGRRGSSRSAAPTSDWVSVRPSSRSFQMKVACRMKIATSAAAGHRQVDAAEDPPQVAPSSTAASNTLCAIPVKKLRITNAENGIADRGVHDDHADPGVVEPGVGVPGEQRHQDHLQREDRAAEDERRTTGTHASAAARRSRTRRPRRSAPRCTGATTRTAWSPPAVAERGLAPCVADVREQRESRAGSTPLRREGRADLHALTRSRYTGASQIRPRTTRRSCGGFSTLLTSRTSARAAGGGRGSTRSA